MRATLIEGAHILVPLLRLHRLELREILPPEKEPQKKDEQNQEDKEPRYSESHPIFVVGTD
jgi:hypothetical protein